MTLEQIRAMSDDEIIRAIAPLQGFSVVSEANRRKEYHFSADERDRIYGFIVDSRGRRKGKIKPIPAWATDLNAAMTLVPQGDEYKNYDFDEKLAAVLGTVPKQAWFRWGGYAHNKPRAICEAFLLWKGSAT